MKRILVATSTTEYATANYLITALRRKGMEVFVYSDVSGSGANQKGSGFFSGTQLLKSISFDPDLFLFVEGGTQRLFPYDLEKLRCLTAWYGLDTHMDYAKHLKISRGFDVTFLAHKEYVDRFMQDGIRQVFWLPVGVAPELYPQTTPSEKLYDIAYVGGMDGRHNPERMALIDAIRERFAERKLFFGPADPEEMIRIYSQTRIVFNKSINNDINMRVFEGGAAGALVITDRITGNGWEELFNEAPFVIYKDKEDLLAKLSAMLEDEPGRQERAAELSSVLWREHTYDSRINLLLERVSGAEKIKQDLDPGYYHSVLHYMRLRKTLVGFLFRALVRNFTVNER